MALGKPPGATIIETFYGRLRAECPKAHRMLQIDDARNVREAWRRSDHELFPHSAMGAQRPATLFDRPGQDEPAQRDEDSGKHCSRDG